MLQATFAWNPEKLQNMLHTHPIWMTTIAHSVKKKTKQKSRKHALFWQTEQEKKIENETKKTLLQLTTYVMCHKLNSDFSKLCLLSWPDALEFWRKIKKKWISHKKITQMP